MTVIEEQTENQNDPSVAHFGLKGVDQHEKLFRALSKDKLIEGKLHVIAQISNICEYKRRYFLMSLFIEHMLRNDDVILYIVELAYGDQEFKITNKDNPRHLQLRTEHALWHKENLINLGVKHLLPPDWKAFAWIDGDIEFQNLDWAKNTLKALRKFDIVQLFSLCLDLDKDGVPMNIWQSFGFKFCHGQEFIHKRGLNYWHCGYAWACTREFYHRINGLYERSILGSGDYILSQALFNKVASLNTKLDGFHSDIKEHHLSLCHDKVKMEVGYVPATIKHNFHGSKQNRKYTERNQILIKHNFNPKKHIKYNSLGVMEPTDDFPQEFLDDIMQYFRERNEDD